MYNHQTMTDQNKQVGELICHDLQVPGSEFICQALSTFLIFTGGEHNWHLSNTGPLHKVEV